MASRRRLPDRRLTVRVLIQWTRANPTDWETLDMTSNTQWRQLPSKPEPVGGEVIDDDAGWVYGLNVQGIGFDGYDHYSVQMHGAGLDVTIWNDDPVDHTGEFRALVWTLLLPTLDPRYGQVNTRQALTVYDEVSPSPWIGQTTSMGPVTVLPWADFNPPQANMTRHGIWVSDTLADLHKGARALHGWREWIGVG